ncbi:MAG TPA: hypothetical protein G4N96_12275 [Chloroflexi bacterium]|nr:MAG: hypothetical protein B6243_07375 [Anaerolineaceae bacterium 4572_5.2]HEY85873.1 hypothetical protein [Chloroflexota bacterium]
MSKKASQARMFGLGMALVLLLGICIQWLFADAASLAVDEAALLMWLRLINHGYIPYTEIYITYPPFFPIFLALSWKIAPGLLGISWLSFVHTFTGVVAVALLAGKIRGAIAGIAAGVFLTVAFFPVGILAEKPSIAWSLWAIFFALTYQSEGKRHWLILSAVSMTLSFMTKLQSPFAPALIALIIGARFFGGEPLVKYLQLWRLHWRVLLLDALLWLSIFFITLLSFFLFYDFNAFLEPGILQHISARAIYMDEDGYWISSLKRLIEFVEGNLFLLFLALLGLIQSVIFKTKYRFTLIIWFALASLTLLSNRPLREKHFAVFLPVLAIWGGIALSYIIKQISLWVKEKAPQAGGLGGYPPASPFPSVLNKGLTVAGVFLSAAYLLWLTPIFIEGARSGPLNTGPSQSKQDAAAYIDKVTTEDECLLTDNMRLAYWSQRLVPPELAEVSSNRFKSGHLTLERLIVVSDKYDCQIAATSSRVARYTPAYKEWVQQNYLGSFRYSDDDGDLLYVARSNTIIDPDYPLSVNLGDKIRFLGYSLYPAAIRPNQALTLVLYWEALDSGDVDYTIFTQLRDQDNTTYLSADHQPFEGAAPTSKWRAGSVLKDVVKFQLPSDLPAGQYRLALGMYSLDTMERLPIQNDVSGENAILLPYFNVN